MPVEQYGFRDIHTKMDAHAKREDKRAKPRRTNGYPGENTAAPKSQRVPVTNGVQVKRGEHVAYPYGGKPYETIVRPQRAKAQWKRDIEDKRDQIGKRVAREISAARPGCTLIKVRATEATALAHKIRGAMKGAQLRDRFNTNAGSKLYQARTKRVLNALAYAAATGDTVTLGVYTRTELKIIGAQRINAKHYTRHVRNLEAKLAGRR